MVGERSVGGWWQYTDCWKVEPRGNIRCSKLIQSKQCICWGEKADRMEEGKPYPPAVTEGVWVLRSWWCIILIKRKTAHQFNKLIWARNDWWLGQHSGPEEGDNPSPSNVSSEREQNRKQCRDVTWLAAVRCLAYLDVMWLVDWL